MANLFSFAGEAHHPFCPKCGVPLDDFMCDGDTDLLCPHVVFLFSDLVSEMLYCASSLEPAFMKAGGEKLFDTAQWDNWLVKHELNSDEADQFDQAHAHPIEVMMNRFGTKNWMGFSVSSRGMACGPIFETIHVIYDLSL